MRTAHDCRSLSSVDARSIGCLFTCQAFAQHAWLPYTTLAEHSRFSSCFKHVFLYFGSSCSSPDTDTAHCTHDCSLCQCAGPRMAILPFLSNVVQNLLGHTVPCDHLLASSSDKWSFSESSTRFETCAQAGARRITRMAVLHVLVKCPLTVPRHSFQTAQPGLSPERVQGHREARQCMHGMTVQEYTLLHGCQSFQRT